MCGRYALIVTDGLGKRFFIHIPALNLRSSFNITPGDEMPVVYTNDGRHMETMRWGLIPSWAKDSTLSYRMINARCETVATRPAFRSSFRQYRCLVPASGFYEWKKVRNERIPYYYHLKGADYLAFAGLYSIWRSSRADEIRTYTIITTDANPLVAQVHDRMPVVLREEDEDAWLDPDTSLEDLQAMLVPSGDERWESYRVSEKVNNPEHDNEDLIRPLEEQQWW